MKPVNFQAPARRMRGLSLIELMISLLLGLLVVGGALSVFSSNRITYRATESLGRVQENARVAFELMAADIRDGASVSCANDVPLSNVLDPVPGQWWRDWNNGIRGFGGGAAMPGATATTGSFGAGAGNRVAGTDAIELHAGVPTGARVTANMATGADDLTVSDTAGVQVNDLMMVCGYGFDDGLGGVEAPQATIFQATAVGANSLAHAQGPGANCQGNMGHPFPPGGYDDCPGGTTATSTAGTVQHIYRTGETIARYRPTRWYVGFNGRCARCMSIYQVVLTNPGAVVGQTGQEVAELGDVPAANLNPLRLNFLTDGAANYVAAGAVASWQDVTAVQVAIDFYSPESLGSGVLPLQRTLQHVVTLRNRAP